MALKKKPVTGMKDMMPSEMEVRDYVISLIRTHIRLSGSHRLRPPAWSTLKICAASRAGTTRS